MVQVTWIIPEQLAHAEYPYMKDLDYLYRQGIRAIVSLQERPAQDSEIIRKKFEYLEVPVQDETPPTLEQLQRINRFIDEKRDENKPVLVHCFAGGRSGTALACYLMHKGWYRGRAMREIRSRVPHRKEPTRQQREEILEQYERMEKENWEGKDV